ncbi:MAG: acetyl-CoA carboxylase biotin carboxyl carrier protein [Sphingosinicella sp.]
MSEPSERDPMRVDSELIRQLADLLTEHDLSEIEVEDGDRKIVVKRHAGALPPAAALAAPAPPITHAAVPPPPPGPAPAAAPADPASHPGAVKSPMVGTVFLASEPGASPFVSPGTQVAEGETLLIIEAMKVMNPITAPRAGTVKQVLVQDAQPVEFDQVLVVLE